jgi:hypothetical protein
VAASEFKLMPLQIPAGVSTSPGYPTASFVRVRKPNSGLVQQMATIASSSALSACRWPSSRYAEALAERLELAQEVLRDLELGKGGSMAGNHVDLAFVIEGQGFDRHDNLPDNWLRLSLNPDSSYGAFIWCVNSVVANESQHSDDKFVWLSYNANPPTFDPEVVADPHLPSYFNRHSAFPTPVVITVVEEYCRAGTGRRPETIDWVHGELDGSWANGDAPLSTGSATNLGYAEVRVVDDVGNRDPFAGLDDLWK